VGRRHRPLIGAYLLGAIPAFALLCLLAAINASPVAAATLTVTRFDDPAPDGCQVDDCSLREAVIKGNADNVAGGVVVTTIVLQAGVYELTRPIAANGTAQLYDDDTPETGDLDIITDQFHAGSTMEIIGAGAATTFIDANAIDRAIDISSYANAVIKDLSIRDGYAYYSNIPGGESHTHGGAIHNHGSLRLERATLSDSTATLYQPNGGGLFNASGATAELYNVTIARNRGLSDGASAPSGGGIEGSGNFSLTNITVVDNIAGGIKFGSGNTATIRNSILANNGADCTGPVLSIEYSLIESDGCTGGFKNAILGGDPELIPLPTTNGYVFLYVPRVGSPVIDSGDPGICPATDEYSISRPQDGNSDTMPICDMGASEFARIAILVTIEDTNAQAIAAPVTPGAGYHSYDIGIQAPFIAASSATHVFLGWEIEHQPYGWAPSMTMTITGNVEVIARYAPRPHFADVQMGQPYTDPVHHLAARGLILGYGNGKFGPTDKVNRAQMAALIARATPGDGPAGHTIAPPSCFVAGSWDCEDWGNDFADRKGLDGNLWRNVGTLQHYGVANGYDGVNFGPNDEVTYAQTISFITRTMVKKGYWVNQPSAPQLFAGVPPGHDIDVRTFAYYAGGEIPNGPGAWNAAQWNSGATRGWFAQALWAALSSYWGYDVPGNGGFVP
jgi:hypothetical protein